MKLLKSLPLFLFIVLTLNIVTKAETTIEDPFSTEYDVIYNVLDTGETQVTQNITITNRKNDIIATTYVLNVKQLNIYEEQGLEGENKIKIKKEINGDTVTLKASFNNPTIGEGKQKKFTIIYKTKNVATKIGEIWNINIPKTQITTNTSLYNVRVIVSNNLGPKLFVSPNPAVEKDEATSTTYNFTKENLTNSGITASFGKYQVVNFKLKFQLENPSILTSVYDVALPPEIRGAQQIKYSQITPEPKKIYIDKDGNTIAQFKISGKDKIEAKLTGSAKIMTKQINPKTGGKFSDIPSNISKEYTKTDTYWETKGITVQQIAKQLYNANQTVAENAQNIYNYITQNFKYDFEGAKKSSVTRDGAQKTLSKNDPVTCMEFTDSFIALARAMKIPAREVNGYAFTNSEINNPVSIDLRSGDALHAWAQFYDPEFGWIQIDPTWGTTSKGMDYFTKLDTNHLAFVIKGVDSEYPLPAGMYRYVENEKLVDVNFSQIDTNTDFNENLTIQRKFNWNILEFLKGNRMYSVRNEGPVFVYNVAKNTITPRQEKIIYLPKNETKLIYENFEGDKVMKSLGL